MYLSLTNKHNQHITRVYSIYTSSKDKKSCAVKVGIKFKNENSLTD